MGKTQDTEIICAISTFSPQIFSHFSFPQKSPSPFSGRSPAFPALCPHFPAEYIPLSGGNRAPLFLVDLQLFQPITSLFRRQPSSPISGRTLPPFSGRSPPLSGGDRALLFPAELCLHFPARSSAFSDGDLPYFRQNSPFSGAVSTTDRALHF
jgi:hypothetical protein